MKCMPITLPGRRVTAASSVIEMEEVFVARMQSAGAFSSIVRKIVSLTGCCSVAASIDESRLPHSGFEVRGDGDVLQGGALLIFGERPLLDLPVEVGGDRPERFLQEVLPYVHQNDREAILRKHMGDAVPHRSGTHDRDSRDGHRHSFRSLLAKNFEALKWRNGNRIGRERQRPC